jgi:hypothetical protein
MQTHTYTQSPQLVYLARIVIENSRRSLEDETFSVRWDQLRTNLLTPALLEPEKAWARLFDLLTSSKLFDLRGDAAQSSELVVLRRLTDYLSQPLTALLALLRGRGADFLRETSERGETVVVHVVGAQDGGAETLGGDDKWRLLQMLLPGRPKVNIHMQTHAQAQAHTHTHTQGRCRLRRTGVLLTPCASYWRTALPYSLHWFLPRFHRHWRLPRASFGTL